MRSEYVRFDYHFALAVALSYDEVMVKPTKTSLEALWRCVEHFGLSPRSRRTLQWEIAKGEEAAQKSAARKPPAAPVADPRRTLRALG